MPTTNLQPKKKKLKLKSFDSISTTTETILDLIEDEENTDTFYDHNLFDPLQLDTHVNTTNCQFIDAATEAQLTATANDEEDLKEIVKKQMNKLVLQQQQVARVPQNTINDLVTFTNPVTNYECLGTDFDFENIFEPDESMADAVVVDSSQNLIRVTADTGSLNDEYRSSSSIDCLSLSSIKDALKSLKVLGNKHKTVEISECSESSDFGNKKQKIEEEINDDKDLLIKQTAVVVKFKSECSGGIDTVLIPSPAGSCDDYDLNRGHEEEENKASSESLANITSTTLTPPSPSPEIKKPETTNTSTNVITNNTPPSPSAAVGLNKITILSNTNNNSNRFKALNKVF